MTPLYDIQKKKKDDCLDSYDTEASWTDVRHLLEHTGNLSVMETAFCLQTINHPHYGVN